jgi:hypothetical protein
MLHNEQGNSDLVLKISSFSNQGTSVYMAKSEVIEKMLPFITTPVVSKGLYPR